MKWQPVLGGAAVVTAAATALLAIAGDDAGETEHTENTNSCPAEGTRINVDCEWNLPDPEEDDAQEIIDEARDFVDVPPRGDGPWPFAVAGSDIGLKVRSTNTLDGEQLGGIQELHTAWVVCQTDSGFNPDPTTDGGTRWYEVRWDQHTPSTAFFESSPSADGTAWAYAGYLYPVGHNGNVPVC